MRSEQEARRPRSAVWSATIGALLAVAVQAQGFRPQAPPPLVPESLVGSVSFDLYCAS